MRVRLSRRGRLGNTPANAQASISAKDARYLSQGLRGNVLVLKQSPLRGGLLLTLIHHKQGPTGLQQGPGMPQQFLRLKKRAGSRAACSGAGTT